jgi:hypothetical protein
MNYKQESITGTSYLRAKSVKIDSPVNQTPTVYFVEEQVTTLASGEVLTKEVDQLLVSYDPLAAITVLDPATGLPTGSTLTHAQIYQYLYSVYMAAATKRDQGI